MKAAIRKIDNTYWICCGNCGHKLARLMPHKKREIHNELITIEFKCSSCKSLVELSEEVLDEIRRF